MSNNLNGVDMKNGTYYFFVHMINIKNLDTSKIKIGQESCKNILIYHIEYLTVKDRSYATINSVNSLYLFINEIKVYIEESSRNEYLTLVPNYESKETPKSKKNYGAKSDIFY